MAKRYPTVVIGLCLLLLCTGARAQRIKDTGFRTIAYVKADGTIQDSGFKAVGYFKDDGRIQDSSFRGIGYAENIPMKRAAWFFFFKDP